MLKSVLTLSIFWLGASAAPLSVAAPASALSVGAVRLGASVATTCKANTFVPTEWERLAKEHFVRLADVQRSNDGICEVPLAQFLGVKTHEPLFVVFLDDKAIRIRLVLQQVSAHKAASLRSELTKRFGPSARNQGRDVLSGAPVLEDVWLRGDQRLTLSWWARDGGASQPELVLDDLPAMERSGKAEDWNGRLFEEGDRREAERRRK